MEMHGQCRCIRCSSYCGMLSLAIRWSSISQVRVETTIRSELSASTVFKESITDLQSCMGTGHGTQIADRAGDEDDGLCETICPCDFKTVSPLCSLHCNLICTAVAEWFLMQKVYSFTSTVARAKGSIEGRRS